MQLLKQAGLLTGHILLLTDGVAHQEKAEVAAKKAQAAHYSVSIIAFGTTQGSLIPLVDGGVVKNRQGKQVVSRLDPLSLKKIAQAGGGLYSEARTDNKDLERLMVHYKKNSLLAYDKNNKQQLYTSINDGIWLLLPLIPLFLLLFRQGYLLSLLLLVFITQPQAVYAFEWANLWLNDDQHAKRLFEQKDFSAAEQQFNSQHWQAISAYQQGDYQRAQRLLEKADTADDWYNKGTIFAKMGKLHKAVSALQLALKKQPNHQDARYNLKIIQDHLLTQTVASFDKENPQLTKTAAKNKQESKQQHTQEGQKKATEQEKEKWQLSTQKPIDPTSQQEQERFKQQWLRSIPDDPSGLWRRKFKQQYQQRGKNDEEEHW
jgi:Ca-activated chloride channel family protein